MTQTLYAHMNKRKKKEMHVPMSCTKPTELYLENEAQLLEFIKPFWLFWKTCVRPNFS
jgi:hypothetical protein